MTKDELAQVTAEKTTREKQLADAKARLRQQNAVYAENEGKLFGEGARRKKLAAAEIKCPEAYISQLEKENEH